MKQLVFVDNNRPVTDSLTVAETFEKDHDKVNTIRYELSFVANQMIFCSLLIKIVSDRSRKNGVTLSLTTGTFNVLSSLCSYSKYALSVNFILYPISCRWKTTEYAAYSVVAWNALPNYDGTKGRKKYKFGTSC